MAIVGALAQNSSRCERPALRCAIGGIGLFISSEFREDGLLSYAVPLAENAVLAVLAGPNPETSLVAPLINLPDGKCCIQFAAVRRAAEAYTPSPQQ
jgi:hypothetical protein